MSQGQEVPELEFTDTANKGGSNGTRVPTFSVLNASPSLFVKFPLNPATCLSMYENYERSLIIQRSIQEPSKLSSKTTLNVGVISLIKKIKHSASQRAE